MRRKLFIGLLICVLLITLLASCNGKQKTLTEYGEDVISLMAEMIESDDYKSLYDLPDAYDEEINKLCEGNYSKITAVYQLSIPEEELFESFDTAINKEDFSKDLYQSICSSAYMSFASRVNQASGVESMAVSSIFAAQKSFVNGDMDVNKIYLYVFKNGCPIAITFVTGDDGSFRAVGHFILNDSFVTDDEDSIIESCEALGIKGVTVKKQ